MTYLLFFKKKPTYHPPQPTKTVKFEEEIVCEWNGCGEKIPTEISLQDHIINSHFSLFEKQLYYHEVAAQKNYKPINPNKSFSFYSHSPPKTPSRRAPPPPLNFMTSPIGTTPIKKTCKCSFSIILISFIDFFFKKKK